MQTSGYAVGDYVECAMEYEGGKRVRIDVITPESIEGEVIADHDTGRWLPVYDVSMVFERDAVTSVLFRAAAS